MSQPSEDESDEQITPQSQPMHGADVHGASMTGPIPVFKSPLGREVRLSVGLLAALALLNMVAPIAIDLYLPGLPQIMDELGTTASSVQLTVTALLVGLMAGQLTFGPLSDRFGRRTPLLVGVSICVLAGVATVIAPTIELLIAARVLQGFGGAAGMVIARALISDLASGREAARAFSIMMSINGIAPMIGPVVGGLLADAIGWRGLLAIVLGMSVIMLVSSSILVPETRPHAVRQRSRGSGTGIGDLLTRNFIGNVLIVGFTFGGLMSFVSASPFIYQDLMGLSATGNGLMFAINGAGIVIASATSARLVRRMKVGNVMAIGLTMLTTGAIALVVLAALGAPPLWLTVPLFVSAASVGFVPGNASARALTSVRGAGLASAVLGACQFGIGAIISSLAALSGEGNVLVLGCVLAGAAAAAVLSHLVIAPRTM